MGGLHMVMLFLIFCLAGHLNAVPATEPSVARVFDVASFAARRTPTKTPGHSAAVIFARPNFRILSSLLQPGRIPAMPILTDRMAVLLRDSSYQQEGKAVMVRLHGFTVREAGTWAGDIIVKTPLEALLVISNLNQIKPPIKRVIAQVDVTYFDESIRKLEAGPSGARESDIHYGDTLTVRIIHATKPLRRMPPENGDLVWFVVSGMARVTQSTADLQVGPGTVVWIPGGPAAAPYEVTPTDGNLQIISTELAR